MQSPRPEPTPEGLQQATAAAPPPASVAAGQRPPLRRSSTDKLVGGVCGGLARYSGIESVLWRIGFIVLGLMGPGIPVYLLLWLVMPVGPDGPDDVVSGLRAKVWTALTPTT